MKYIILEMTISPTNDMDVETLKEMLLNNGTSLPSEGSFIYHGDNPIAKLGKVESSIKNVPHK